MSKLQDSGYNEQELNITKSLKCLSTLMILHVIPRVHTGRLVGLMRAQISHYN